MCVIFLGSSWVLLLGVQGAVVAVASTPRATQSSARLRRRGSLACLLAACRWESKKWMRRWVLFGGSFFASSISTFQWVSHNRSRDGGASQYTLQVLRCFHACFKTLQWRFHWVKKSFAISLLEFGREKVSNVWFEKPLFGHSLLINAISYVGRFWMWGFCVVLT